MGTESVCEFCNEPLAEHWGRVYVEVKVQMPCGMPGDEWVSLVERSQEMRDELFMMMIQYAEDEMRRVTREA